MTRSSALIFSATLGLLILGFQNCSNGMNFSSSGELVSKAAIDVTETTDTATDTAVAGDPDRTRPPTTGGRSEGSTEGGRGNHTHPDSKLPCSNPSHTNTDTKTALRFVCILRDSGKSERIGLTDGTLAGQVSTPRDVCMSENACLKILSSKFDVRSAEPRGFCKNLSAHVVSMTDLEVQTALARADLNRAMATTQQPSR